MYVIRVPGPGELEITFSERVTTAEALRAVSQAFALADAGSVTSAVCDLTAIERGPGDYLELAVALATRIRPGMKVAFVASRAQRPFVNRLARFSGIREGLGVFETRTEAELWRRASTGERQLSAREMRHYRELARPRPQDETATRPVRRGAA